MARILVVEDTADLRNALTCALKMEGHVVETADDGEQGVAMQAAFGAEILITDIFMPNKDGIETIQEFRDLSPTTRIVAMSAGGKLNSSVYLRIAEQMGVDVILQKPFGIQELLDVVARLEKSLH